MNFIIIIFISNEKYIKKRKRVSLEYTISIHQGQRTNQEHKVQKSIKSWT